MTLRRVFAFPDGSQLLVSVDSEAEQVDVSTRPDQWSTWSAPLKQIRVDDDPPDARRRYPPGQTGRNYPAE